MPGYDPAHDRPYDWLHIIASVQVIARQAVLHTITINHPDPGAGATITIHDVASVDDIAAGNIVANIAVDDNIFVVPATLVYDVGLTNGLYVLFSAGITTADITVSYK